MNKSETSLESHRKANKDLKKGFFYGGIAIVIIAVTIPFLIMWKTNTPYNVDDIGLLGPVGDFFGGSTIGLLSIASIFFIIHTIRIQSKELELTRNELEDTRMVHEKSNELINIQRFENTFFNLLGLHNDIVANIKVTFPNGTDKTGRKALAYINNELKNDFIRPNREIREQMDQVQTQKDKLNLVYLWFFKSYGPEIGHYFRNLFRIMKVIDKSPLTDEEKKDYIGILRAQLSSAELKLLFYNCISTHGESFKDLAVKYNFFDGHLTPEDLISEIHYEYLNQ